MHLDGGVLGAGVRRVVWGRGVEKVRGVGVNAIRMSHNPQAPVVYDQCDELGLLVMDEASDEWEFPKRKWIEGWNVGTPGFDGSYDFFEEWIERDVTDMVRRDRNHPSVFLWSIGNEVDSPEGPYSPPVLDGTSINQPMFGGYNPDAPVALRSGEIVACQIVGCTGGTAGSPGELKGKFISDHALGRICINGENGVYGTVSTAIAGQQTELAFAQEVLPGAAEILTTTSGETPRSYRVYIEKVNDADPHRNMVLRVTDPALLAQTGGIVQGMSGSPILQNGRLVGAVTHVLVNDPTRGYGIFAQTMLEQAHSVPGTDAAA